MIVVDVEHDDGLANAPDAHVSVRRGPVSATELMAEADFGGEAKPVGTSTASDDAKPSPPSRPPPFSA